MKTESNYFRIYNYKGQAGVYEANFFIPGRNRKRIKVPQNIYSHLSEAYQMTAIEVWAQRKQAEYISGKDEKLKAERKAVEAKAKSQITCNELFPRFLESIKNRGSMQTYLSYSAQYRNHISKVIGNIPVAEVKSSHSEKIYSDCKKKLNQKGEPLSVSTLETIIACLKSFLNYAKEETIIEHIPRVPKVISKTTYDKISDDEYFSDEEVKQLEAAAEKLGLLYWALLLLGLDAGMRRGEIAALNWRRIDFSNRMIHIRVAWSGVGNNAVLGLPKGKKTRSVQMTNRLYDALKTLSIASEATPDATVLGVNGIPQMLALWDRLVLASGLKDANHHKCRHTCATRIGRRTKDPYEVMTWLGHSDIKVSMRYIHTKSTVSALNALEAHIAESHGLQWSDKDELIMEILELRKELQQLRREAVAAE